MAKRWFNITEKCETCEINQWGRKIAPSFEEACLPPKLGAKSLRATLHAWCKVAGIDHTDSTYSGSGYIYRAEYNYLRINFCNHRYRFAAHINRFCNHSMVTGFLLSLNFRKPVIPVETKNMRNVIRSRVHQISAWDHCPGPVWWKQLYYRMSSSLNYSGLQIQESAPK